MNDLFVFITKRSGAVSLYANNDTYSSGRSRAYSLEFDRIYDRISDIYNQITGKKRILRLNDTLRKNDLAHWEEKCPDKGKRLKIRVYDSRDGSTLEWV